MSIVRDVLREIIDEVVKKTKSPLLPTSVEDLVASFAFGELLTLDNLLEMMGKDDIAEKSKEQFTNWAATAYRRATLWGQPTNKFPLAIWGHIDQHIRALCGIARPKFPFYSIYVFLKQLQGEEV